MGKIYAVRMREYNKSAGCLRRNWAAGKWGITFHAGDATPRRPFRPSPVVEVTKEQYAYIMGRRGDGTPNVGQPHNTSIPVFQGWVFESRQALADMVQNEADKRAAHGNTSARAMLRLREPVEPLLPPAEVDVVVAKATEEKPSPEPSTAPEESFTPMDVAKELADARKPEPEPEPEPDKKATGGKKPGKKRGPYKKRSNKKPAKK